MLLCTLCLPPPGGATSAIVDAEIVAVERSEGGVRCACLGLLFYISLSCLGFFLAGRRRLAGCFSRMGWPQILWGGRLSAPLRRCYHRSAFRGAMPMAVTTSQCRGPGPAAAAAALAAHTQSFAHVALAIMRSCCLSGAFQ